MKVGRVIVVVVIVALSVAACLLFTGPRMKDQPSVRTYEAAMRLPTPNTVPVEGIERIPDAAEAARLVNPVAPDVRNIARGGVYYGYYCIFCHGPRGRGEGPVGQSYLPTIPDLGSAAIQRRSDGELYRAMLAGAGHAPVMGYTIPPRHRWYIVTYLRTFADNATK